MSARRLSPEIWFMIFEYVALLRVLIPNKWGIPTLKTPIALLLPLLYVCKNWKEMVTPLVYRHITIESDHNAKRIFQNWLQNPGSSTLPGRSCRTLLINHTSKGLDKDMLSILWMLPNLRSLTATHGVVSYHDLGAIATTASGSLEELKISLDGYKEPLDMCLKGIGRLWNLHNLDIRINHAEFYPSFNMTPGMHLLYLHRLSLTYGRSGGDRHKQYALVLRHLSQNRLPALKRVSFNNIEAGPDVLPTIHAFMSAHGAQLERFDWLMDEYHDRPTPDFPQTVFPFLTRLRHLSIYNDRSLPPVELLSMLPPTLLHLGFRTFENFRDSDFHESFNLLIEALVADGTCAASLRSLQNDAEYFTWNTSRHWGWSEDEEGLWRRAAVRLKSGGISLLDTDGNVFSSSS